MPFDPDVEAIITACRRHFPATLRDFDDLELQGLKLFAEDAATSAKSNALALHTIVDWIGKCVVDYFALEQRLAEAPALLNVPLASPVFLVSAGRTGSTLLQRLLALDPTVRTPSLWELWHPRPAADVHERNRMIHATEARLKAWPAFALKLHPMAAEAPDECFWIMRHNTIRASFHITERYWEWIKALDNPSLATLYEGYRRRVQLIHAGAPDRRWMSKTSAHMLYMPVLFDLFPGARIVRIHRDPRQVVGSYCSLMRHVAGGGNPAALGRIVTAIFADGLDRLVAAVDGAHSDRFVDIMYEELRDSPSHVAVRTAKALGLDDHGLLGPRIDRYLATPTAIRSASHAYSVEDFVLTPSMLMTRFENYIAWVRRRFDPRFCS